jgi:hypothetical protein
MALGDSYLHDTPSPTHLVGADDVDPTLPQRLHIEVILEELAQQFATLDVEAVRKTEAGSRSTGLDCC